MYMYIILPFRHDLASFALQMSLDNHWSTASNDDKNSCKNIENQMIDVYLCYQNWELAMKRQKLPHKRHTYQTCNGGSSSQNKCKIIVTDIFSKW